MLRGKHDEIKLVLAALACHGHVLFEDVPGTGKTVLARAIARSVEDTAFARIQCTPDLQPSDVTGVNIYDQKLQDFEFRRGPLFANVVLVDEINRAMPKTQSALLEAMAERQVTIDGQTYVLPQPFLVLATENPIEFEGVFPLPEAQLDRFFLKARLGYPDEDDELGGRPRPAGGPPARPPPAGGRASPSSTGSRRRSAPCTWTTSSAAGRSSSCARRASSRRSRSAARCAAASRWNGPPAPGRCSTAARTRRPTTSSGCSPPSSATGSCSRRRSSPSRAAASRDEILNEVYATLCRGGAAARSRDGARRPEVDVAELSFPLVPRWRPVGSAFGRLRAARRGIGSSVATTRAVPSPATTRA